MWRVLGLQLIIWSTIRDLRLTAVLDAKRQRNGRGALSFSSSLLSIEGLFVSYRAKVVLIVLTVHALAVKSSLEQTLSFLHFRSY